MDDLYQQRRDLMGIVAIRYLVDNGVGGSEWQEAGMWNAVQRVMALENQDKNWTNEELDQLIADAESN